MEGAVSEQAAKEMLAGALTVLGTDYAFAVTGQLSPGGEEENRVEIGTVWMAVGNKEGIKTKKIKLHYDRHQNKELATSMGLLMIWKFINEGSRAALEK
jgi:nicotinamide-nucleotide amidase